MRSLNPLGVIAVEVDPSGLDYITSDGRRYADVALTLDEDAHIRLRTGYQCVHCLEIFRTAWPDDCPMCGFPVATAQREIIQRHFEGFVKMPPRGLTADELARGEEEYLRKVKEARL